MLLCIGADRTAYLARVALGRRSWRAAIFTSALVSFQALGNINGDTGVSMGVG